MLNNWLNNSSNCVDNIFADTNTNNNNNNSYKYGIIGGGLAGLLLALRLSRDDSRVKQGLILWERMPSLGGRLFFGGFDATKPSLEEPEKNDFMQRLQRIQQNNSTGFGLEMMPPHALTIISRHIASSLTEAENAFLEDFTKSINQYLNEKTTLPTARKNYLIKKTVTLCSDATLTSSELFTKAEALTLTNWLQSKSTEIWGDSAEWKSLSNTQRESFTQLLETLIGNNFIEYPVPYIVNILSNIFTAHSDISEPLFFRRFGIELALELILRSRGVVIKTQHRVHKVISQQNQFLLNVANGLLRQDSQVQVQQLILACPLISTLPFLPRTAFSGVQAKATMKYPPQSVIAVEYSNYNEHILPDFIKIFDHGSHFIFPVERILGYLNSNGKLILYAYLNYEDSLQAPAVREAIARVRKSLGRILNKEAIQNLTEQTNNQNTIYERVILVPIARYPNSNKANLQECTMGAKNLFCCGDAFAFTNEPWQNVIQSVLNVSSNLTKG